jgi:hypothetical protein
MTRTPLNWPRLVFIFVPLLIVIVDAVVLVGERVQPDTEKAIRLVKESNSRKENFTLQQYLYITVYHRKASGETINIEGWRAAVSAEPGNSTTVEFSYEDSSGNHVAVWEANLKVGTVTPKNEAALDRSWH